MWGDGMTKIIEFVLTVAVLAWIAVFCSLVIKRINLLRSIKRISKISGVGVKMLKNPLLSLAKVPREPEILVDILGDIYLVRTYNGGGAGNVVHFASKRFTVRFSRFKTATFRAPRGRFFTVRGFSVGGKIKTVEPIALQPELSLRDFKEVIIFNPAPGEVSYVTEEKTSIKVAFTGDEVYGRKIFTTSTFENFVDREVRSIKAEGKMPERDIWESLYAK